MSAPRLTPCVGYVVDSGVGSNYLNVTLEEQLASVKFWSLSNDYTYQRGAIEKITLDTPFEERPVLMQLMNSMAPGSILVVYSFPYVYCDLQDYLEFKHFLESKNIRIHIFRQNLNNLSPVRTYFLTLYAAELEFHLDDNKKPFQLDNVIKHDDFGNEIVNTVFLHEALSRMMSNKGLVHQAEYDKLLQVVPIRPNLDGRYVKVKCYGYTRVSTKKQSAHGMSLEVQEVNIKEWAKETGCTIVEIATDKGVSGTEIANLKELNRLINSMEYASLLIVPDVSRLIRSVFDYYKIIERLFTKQCKLFLISENFEIVDMEGAKDACKYVELAQLQVMNTSESIKSSLKYKTGRTEDVIQEKIKSKHLEETLVREKIESDIADQTTAIQTKATDKLLSSITTREFNALEERLSDKEFALLCKKLLMSGIKVDVGEDK